MLHGRGEEQRTIDALLDAARSGISGALVIRGEPGIGKTALLDYAADKAAGMRVLRSAGIESEAELPFAGLHLLFRPGADQLEALPAPQRRALSTAFGLESGGHTDRFMIGAGVLSLLADIAEEAPLLCLVDDAQWLDRSSADALLFAARRLDREGVVIVFALRDYAEALTATGLPELELTGLDTEAANALLADGAVELPPAVKDQLLAETHGNPLALLELPSLASTQSSRLAPMPLTSRVIDAFHHRVRLLPPASQTALSLVAADDTGDLATLLRAGTDLGVAVDALHPAAESGLIVLTSTTVTFRHPLIRASAYHGASLRQRIAVHAALASAYGGDDDIDRRAWHLASAATGPDEQVATELERAAGRAAARSGYAAAAAAYDRAAQLSTDPEAAIRRRMLACEAGLHSGRPEWARTRAERLLPTVTDPAVRTRLIEVRASAHFSRGELRRAHELLSAAAAEIAGDDPERALWMLVEAVHASWALPTDRELIAGAVDRFADLGVDREEPSASVAHLVRWGTAAVLQRDPSGFRAITQVLPIAKSAARAIGPLALMRMYPMVFSTGRDADCADIATTLVDDARAGGQVFAVAGGLGLLSLTQVLLGRHRDAWVSGNEAIRIGRDTGQALWVNYAYGALAYLAAIEGDEETCRRYAEEVSNGESSQQGAAGLVWTRAALALLDLGAGRVRAAYDGLRSIADGPARHQGGVVRCVPDHVEAAVRLGRADETADPMALFSAWADTMRLPWIDALLARCHALMGRDEDAEEHYVRALKLHDEEPRPFERARTALLYGEWLRRWRRKSEARVHLTAALRTFEELGSSPWAARARAELGASGAPVAPAAISDAFSGLTPQEFQITQLAARGRSNRDIAAQLFLSPRTVAYHLYKAYPKLGIRSRGELAALVSG